RDDVCDAGGAGDADGGVHALPLRGLHRALLDLLLHARAPRGSQHLAGARPGRAHHRGDRGERPHSGRQPGHAPRAHHGPRGDGARVLRPPSGAHRGGGGREAASVPVAHRLRVHPVGHGGRGRRARRAGRRPRDLRGEAPDPRLPVVALRDGHRQDARLPRARVPRGGAHARPPRHHSAVRLEGAALSPLDSDIAHLLAGSMLLARFLLLYQARMFALLHFFALHACVLALSVGWQAYLQRAPHLYITALIALAFKGVFIPVALHRIVVRLGIHRTIEAVVSIGPTMLFGMALVALAIVVMLPVTATEGVFVREDLALAGLLAVPAGGAIILATIPRYRVSAALNVAVCALTLASAAALYAHRPEPSLYLLVDDVNTVFLLVGGLVGFTTSLFSAGYIAHELETRRLKTGDLRFYHAMYQLLMFAMNLALVANNIGLMWVAIELATLTTVVMVGL